MDTNLDKYKKDLADLLERANLLNISLIEENREELSASETKSLDDALKKHKILPFKQNYERWYSEAQAVVRQILPSRLDDFASIYKDSKRKEITYETYRMSDYMIGLQVSYMGEKVFSGFKAAVSRFQQQIGILASAEQRFNSSLFDIRQIVQADLFDSELEAAEELRKHSFLRAAGALAGVVLEKHLKQVCDNHELTIAKKNPHISDLNNLLKTEEVIDIPVWRGIQLLGDLRNLCDHDKKSEPTAEQVKELIQGVEKLVKTIF